MRAGRSIALSALLFIGVLALSACALSPKDALVGAWTSRPVDSSGNRLGSVTWEFFKDGTLTEQGVNSNGTDNRKRTLTWSLDSAKGARLIIVDDRGSRTDYFFDLSGDRLVVGTEESPATAPASINAFAFLRVGSTAEKAAAAAEPVYMTEYQKVTDQSEINAIASVDVGSAVVGSDGRYEVSGTITNKSSWPIRVLVEVSVGQVTYKLPEWWEIGPGGQRSFIAHPDAENGLGTVGGYVSDLEVKK